ncbi:cyclic AMP-responsive element-binding protein 5-like [Homalodisca vitripennis]|uniref:cyclic AMP-responsive element-binding protein 5-like n=1 Tax=Homalodisca vitripennis TaxID=197043 RepID=UPI001EEB7233|nr:cyclic AMP-responsive element-binding protein 5-like [Homalodisca vitripennis]
MTFAITNPSGCPNRRSNHRPNLRGDLPNHHPNHHDDHPNHRGGHPNHRPIHHPNHHPNRRPNLRPNHRGDVQHAALRFPTQLTPKFRANVPHPSAKRSPEFKSVKPQRRICPAIKETALINVLQRSSSNNTRLTDESDLRKRRSIVRSAHLVS